MRTIPMIDCSGLRLGFLARFLSLALACPLGVAIAGQGDPNETAKAAAKVEPHSHSQIFAIINGRTVPTSEYESAFSSLIRQKFYHGQVPEKELAGARELVKSRLVQRIVLLEEAGRRGIVPNLKQIEETLAGYDKRYATNPSWLENREKMLPGIKQQLEEQSLVSQLEELVRQVPAATDVEVQAFYDANPELFTEPQKLRLSVILLAVDPSSPATAWDATREEAQAIYKRLVGGAEFADAARLHSSAYAEAGGDMGYLHGGMLPEAIQGLVDKYELGQVNPPLDTLQGVAIFRLDDRLAAKKRDFVDVAGRARDLLMRERQDQAYTGLVNRLVAAADVKFFHGVSAEQRDGGEK